MLRSIVCQRLIDRADGRGRVVMVESITATQKVRDAIASGADAALLERLMSEGDYHGMATADQALFRLFSDDLITQRRRWSEPHPRTSASPCSRPGWRPCAELPGRRIGLRPPRRRPSVVA
ncbi:MAG: hypothetical protein R2711_02360 [Acidimicrobiales bacterium]